MLLVFLTFSGVGLCISDILFARCHCTYTSSRIFSNSNNFGCISLNIYCLNNYVFPKFVFNILQFRSIENGINIYIIIQFLNTIVLIVRELISLLFHYYLTFES